MYELDVVPCRRDRFIPRLPDFVACAPQHVWYKNSVMGRSQNWINERSFAEQLFARWAKLTVDSEKEYF
jgi:hypothetical protein